MTSEELALDGEATPEEKAEAAPAKKKAGVNWWAEIKGFLWLILAVLAFQSFIAKPFYIPSESMLPDLRVGDRLVVTKYPYGWSFVSLVFPDPIAIFDSLVLRKHEESWGVQLPFIKGRLFGHLPQRGDVVIVTPPGKREDYIKRLIGLPGDRLQVQGGVVILNGVPVKRGPLHYRDLPVDDNSTCDPEQYPGARQPGPDGKLVCHLPIVTETLPNGRSYDTVDLESDSQGDNYGPVTIPKNDVFLMGDNRDRSADSRFSLIEEGLGGPVPWEYLGGRAEFVTFSLDGSMTLNPLTWFGAFRGGRVGESLHPKQTGVQK